MAKRPDDPTQLGLFDPAPGTGAPDGAPDSGARTPEPDSGPPSADTGERTASRPSPGPGPTPEPVPTPETPAGVPVTPRRFVDGPLPDAGARARIREALDTNLLVEAGAGSGKTTALVERMVALVRSGTARVDEVAAVTFTRKAAAELRQRFQTALETELAEARDADRPDVVDRLDVALREIDRGFIGTIHSFCARLLRERPIEAGLDPAFRELMGAEEVRQRRAFWRTHLERLSAVSDPLAAELTDVGLVPSQLEPLFDELVANPDVRFPADPVSPPGDAEVAEVREAVDALLDRGAALMPAEAHEDGWDSLQARIRVLLFLRRVVDWDDRTVFLDTIAEELHGRSHRPTQKRWPDGGAAKALGEAWGQLRDGPVAEVLDRWWAHRYPIALAFARRAAEAFEAERRRTGALNFQDLLMLAARLLRTHPGAREELGRRYRRVLVDEFQDTDPVQAEVLMLLSSPADDRPWQEVEPRPGALFVVGDPKQSIYRFRRADIAVYNLVRDRFAEFGHVVELVANFRSLPPIGELVDGVFGDDGRFPDHATPYQAAFAPLRTRRVSDPGRQGVHQYLIDPDGRSHRAAAEDGAARLVPWIAEQVRAGRSPGDFLILARQKAELATYARALEAWRVPVQVTGAGVDRTEELAELLVLLEALADPTDPVRVVAVLVGLLFGLDHDRLADWALDGGRFDITRPHAGDDSAVGRALRQIHRWWERSRTEPADVLVGTIVDDVGLVPLAAARDLGELRAGSLLFALDAIRMAALNGDTSVAAATEALRTALEADEAEAPLEPVRSGVARVMTLHQAKGLEAPVVALVHPVAGGAHPVVRHIERSEDGSAVGYLVVQERADAWRTRVIARPPGWEEKEAEERRFEEAEQDRLLYVAATRAGERLVVARKSGDESRSVWAGLYDWIDAHGDDLRLEPGSTPSPAELDVDADALVAAADRLAATRAERGAASYEVITATTLAKRPAPEEEAGADAAPVTAPLPDPRDGPDPVFRGLSWGIAVHATLDAAGRGVAGSELRRVARSALLEAERPVTDGEPAELDELVGLVERVLESEVWRRARDADMVLSEVPFAYREPGAGPEGALRIMEGVIDLAFREEGGWVIVDYKTDVGTDPGFPDRARAYRRQVEHYARAWEAMTGEPVSERVLLYTARTGERVEERW
ncbi:MAG: UvrD-helicase domain-containing protein [Candidatus Longimicrobiales bacterium M2_2A_002]